MPKRPSLSASLGAGSRALRVTVAAAAGFYPAVHLLDQPLTALYALFAPIAYGVLSPLPGSGRRRAGTVLRALPAAAAMVVLGTVLAVGTWPAVAGMLLVGFALPFGAVCGPRLAGIVPGLQLFYILACFPPYAPDTLPHRLAGLAVGTVLLSLCELVPLGEPAQPTYRGRIADSLDLAGHAASRIVGAEVPDPGLAARLRAAGRALRFSQQPAGTRPTGAGRTDRALAQAGSATRRLLDQLAALAELSPAPDMASETLLGGIAATCARTADALRGARPDAGPGLLEEMVAQFAAGRGGAPGARVAPSHALLLRQSTALTIAVSAVTAGTAVAVATGGRRPVYGLPHEQFWYAGSGTIRLWCVRITGNFTRRSVVFQNAVRIALGLSLARLVAGSLDLSHGFWVLLAVLTLGRTTAGDTWSAVRSATVGTLIGALAAGALLIGAGEVTDVYAYLLVPMMLLAFTVGPVEGPAWAQGLFTLVVSTAFAQIAPVTWRLAEARLIDVLTGSAVGLACGLLAWPSGARAETRRSVTALLKAAAPLVPTTATATTAHDSPSRGREIAPGVLRVTEHRLRIAQSAYAQYRTEPASRRTSRHTTEIDSDWLAALNYGSRVLVGAYWLPRSEGPRTFSSAALRWVRDAAGEVGAATLRAAGPPTGGVCVRLTPLPSDVVSGTPSQALSLLVDVEVWLRALATDLEAATAPRADEADQEDQEDQESRESRDGRADQP
ncbi:FUSC family protein [Streptomyces sp. NPDC048636]|uniref:FUSC family protein n=1 Tax=Streptomyces sp. NPDC048636 TaxID=3155762 RepID=UPI00343376BE